MTDAIKSVDEAIALMNQMVERDGGVVTLRGYDADAQTLDVDYSVEVNEDCPTCMIDAKMLGTFLADSLRSRGIPIEKVNVTEPQRASPAH